MPDKKFTVVLKSGDIQSVIAATGDQDDEDEGYVFFLDSSGNIVGLFAKSAVAEWREGE